MLIKKHYTSSANYSYSAVECVDSNLVALIISSLENNIN